MALTTARRLLDQNSENASNLHKDDSTPQSQKEQPTDNDQKVPSIYKTCRLVGESYIHYPSSQRPEDIEESSWFRLW